MDAKLKMYGIAVLILPLEEKAVLGLFAFSQTQLLEVIT